MFEIGVKTSLYVLPTCLEDAVYCYLPVIWFKPLLLCFIKNLL